MACLLRLLLITEVKISENGAGLTDGLLSCFPGRNRENRENTQRKDRQRIGSESNKALSE
jgi:hypothetical protein